MSVQIPAFPTATGDSNKDITNLLKWAQVVSQHPNFLAGNPNGAINNAVSVRPVTTPCTVQMSDEFLLLTVHADHDLVTLPPPASVNVKGISRKYAMIIVGGTGGANLHHPIAGGKINFSTSDYYFSGNPGGKITLITNGTDYFVVNT